MSEIQFDYLNFVIPSQGEVEESPFKLLNRAGATVTQLSPYLLLDEIQPKGLHGYTWSAAIIDRESKDRVGFVAAGGNSGTVYFNFTGSAQKHLFHPDIKDLLERTKGRLTRVDLCFDDMDGNRTPFDVQKAYINGEFKNRGQNPSHSMAGSWDNPAKWGEGLTYYIGNRKNGKMFRCYHKGRQLGESSSNWVRHEVEYRRANKREIPLEILIDPRSYFVSAYPWLRWAANEDSTHVSLVRQQTQSISLGHLLHHAKRSYGRLLHFLSGHLQIEPELIVKKLSKLGTPERLDKRYLWEHQYFHSAPI
jgi:phage replication initiation protein